MHRHIPMLRPQGIILGSFLYLLKVDINFFLFKGIFIQIIVPFKGKGLSGKSEHIYTKCY